MGTSAMSTDVMVEQVEHSLMLGMVHMISPL